MHLNTLDYSRWDEVSKDETWNDTYNTGFRKLKTLRPKGAKDYKEFSFDILMANPPFAGDIKENQIISRYELGKNANGKWQTKIGRDILFIERNLNFLKPGGRMAIVLPQGNAFRLRHAHLRPNNSGTLSPNPWSLALLFSRAAGIRNSFDMKTAAPIRIRRPAKPYAPLMLPSGIALPCA